MEQTATTPPPAPPLSPTASDQAAISAGVPSQATVARTPSPSSSSSPFRVFDPQALGVDLNRVLDQSHGTSGRSTSQSTSRKTAHDGSNPPLRPRSGHRVARWVFVLVGCATCLYAGRLARERNVGALSPASALGSSELSALVDSTSDPRGTAPLGGGSSALAAMSMPGAAYELLDESWSAERAVLTRLEVTARAAAGPKGNNVPPPTGEVRFLDAQGREQRRSLDKLLALQIARSTGEHSWDTSAHDEVITTARAELEQLMRDAGLTISWLELVDGQRWSGQPADPTTTRPSAGNAQPLAGADELAWISPVFGPVRLPLDRVQRIVFAQVDQSAGAPTAASTSGDAPTGAAASTSVEDTVLLRNGDVLQGLVEVIGAISNGKPVVRIDAGKTGRREVPLDTVAEVRLSNPTDQPTGTRVFLSDGSILAVSSLQTRRGQDVPATAAVAPGSSIPAFDSFEARIDLHARRFPQADGDVKMSSDTTAGAGPSVRLDRRMVTGVVLDASRVRPIHSVALHTQAPSVDRRWTMPSRAENGQSPLGLSSVVFDAPMTVSWDLPENSRRFATIVELGEQAGAWSDCQVVVSAAGSSGQLQELSRERLSAAHPARALSVELPADAQRLTISVEPGRFGPVQDGVRIREAALLTQGMRSSAAIAD